MYSREHALLSLVVGVAGVWALSLPELIPWWAAIGWAVALGVGIDFDHFLVARLVSGDWTAFRRVLRNPFLPLTDPAAIFENDDLWAIQRLLSHAVLGGILVGGLWLWDPSFAVFTALVLYAHVLSDLAWDNYRLEEYQRRHAEYVRRKERAAAETSPDAETCPDTETTRDADAEPPEITRS